MNLGRKLSVLGLVVLAAGSTLLLRQLDEEAAAPADPILPDIGYYLSQTQLTGTGDDGQPLYRLRADEIRQRPSDGRVMLTRVAVDYDPAEDLPWTLNADNGEVLDDGRMITLSGDVVAATRAEDGPVATIRTDYLEFEPATDIASTDRRVTVDYAGNTVRALGLRALLREDRLELLAEVQGHYVP